MCESPVLNVSGGALLQQDLDDLVSTTRARHMHRRASVRVSDKG